MSRIERKYCIIRSHIWQGYLKFSYNFIFQRIVRVLVRKLCDTYHEEIESQRSILDVVKKQRNTCSVLWYYFF